MIILIFGGIVWLIYQDARILKEIDDDSYRKHIIFLPKIWAVAMLLVPFITLPVYVIRRMHYYASSPFLTKDLPKDSSHYLLAESYGILVNWVCAFFAFSLLIKIFQQYFSFFRSQLTVMMGTGLFFTGFLVFLIVREVRPFSWGDFLDKVRLRKGEKSFLSIIVVPVLIGGVLAVISANLIEIRSFQPSTPLMQAMESVTSIGQLFFFWGIAIFLAPFLEEIVFRGYFFTILEKLKGKIFAVVVISLIFGFLHTGQYWGDWAGIIIVAMLGLVLTLLRSWSGSTIPSCMAHFIYNALIIMWPIIFSMNNVDYFLYQIQYKHLNEQQKEQLLRQSVKKSPKLYDAYNDLAWLYAKRKENLVEAHWLINKALKADPANAAYLDTKAEILYQQGEKDRAAMIEWDLVRRYPDVAFYKKQLRRFLGDSIR